MTHVTAAVVSALAVVGALYLIAVAGRALSDWLWPEQRELRKRGIR